MSIRQGARASVKLSEQRTKREPQHRTLSEKQVGEGGKGRREMNKLTSVRNRKKNTGGGPNPKYPASWRTKSQGTKINGSREPNDRRNGIFDKEEHAWTRLRVVWRGTVNRRPLYRVSRLPGEVVGTTDVTREPGVNTAGSMGTRNRGRCQAPPGE